MLSVETLEQAAQVLGILRGRGWMLATAESCTGGLIAAALTHVAGSSDVVERGFVTYSNESKIELLGVDAALIAEHGAVSEPVARAMAAGALARSRVAIALSVTGIAGPGGGSAEKPVGLVWFGCATAGGAAMAFSQFLPGNRAAVRQGALLYGLSILAAVGRDAAKG